MVRTEAASLIRNTGKHQHVVVAPQRAYDHTKVAAFKNFCSDFFDEGAVPSDATELAKFGKDKLQVKRDELAALMSNSRYPFIDQLTGVVDLLDEVVGRPVDWYLDEFNKANELLEAKEDLIDPIKSFLNGQQARIFDDAQTLLNTNSGNLDNLPPGIVEPILDLLSDANAFRGNKMNQLKIAADGLKSQLDHVVAETRADVSAAIEGRRTELLGSTYYANATTDARDRVTKHIDDVLVRLKSESQVAVLLQTGTTFEQNDYPALLSRLVESQQTPDVGTTPPNPMVSVKTISASGVTGVLESEADVDTYLVALRKALIATLNEGKRITL